MIYLVYEMLRQYFPVGRACVSNPSSFLARPARVRYCAPMRTLSGMKAAAIGAALLALLLMGAWLGWKYQRFLTEREEYALLLRSLPERGFTVDFVRRTQAEFDSLIAPGGKKPLDVLYFNDSTMGDGETSMAALFSAGLGRSVEPLTGAGFTPTVARPALETIRRFRDGPALVVIPVNPRAFSNQAPFNADYYENFRRLLALNSWPPLKDFVSCLLSGYTSAKSCHVNRFTPHIRDVGGYFDALSRERERAFEALRPSIPPAELELARDFSDAYMAAVGEDHPLLAELDALAAEALAGGSAVLAYVTPIDAATGERLLGPAFRQRLEQNVRVIGQILAPRGVKLADLSASLGPEHFSDKDYANEHLTARGRALTVDRLVRAARQ